MDISRRTVLTASSAAFLASCMSCPERLPLLENSVAIGDAHTHFFNGSDLPVYGFVRYVAGKEFGSDNYLILGVAEILQALASFFPLSAEAELKKIQRRRRSRAPIPLDVTKEGFATDFATTLDQYVLDIAKKRANSFGIMENNANDEFDILTATEIDDENSILALARELSEANPQDENFTLLQTQNTLSAKTSRQKILDILNDVPIEGQNYFSNELTIEQIGAYIRWGYLLMQSRCALVSEYLKKIKAEDATTNKTIQPKLMINLMVDYDYWISRNANEPPSSHISQIKFWDSYSASTKSEVDIQTFAGFDPLKLAVETRKGIQTTHFDTLKSLYETEANGRPSFAGFKIYPPMGFRPWKNSDLKRDDFGGTNGIGRRIIDLWEGDWGGKDYPLGEALDEALEEAYSFCLKHDIPILAHASPNVLTANNFKNRPSPKHWLDLIKSDEKYSKLRLNLGHFTEAEDFIKGKHDWSLVHIRELFKLSNDDKANVYADIGMMSELLKEDEQDIPNFVAEFFKALKKFCQDCDENCERLMFGTDWIMLGHVVGYKDYLQVILDALNGDPWWAENQRKENFLHGNLRRFLKVDNQD